MSILIKGMEMPDKCGHCRFASAFDCGVTGNFISTHSIRQPDCPLIPVPDHGRLIDADALLDSLLVDYPSVVTAINAAPTIIPADPVEVDE